MSALDHTLAHDEAGVTRRIAHWATGFTAGYQRRSVYRRTVRELRALGDRELADLGLTRANIPQVAEDAVRGLNLR